MAICPTAMPYARPGNKKIMRTAVIISLINGERRTDPVSGSRNRPFEGITSRQKITTKARNVMPAQINPVRSFGETSSMPSADPSYFPSFGSTNFSVIHVPTAMSMIEEVSMK